LTSLRKASKNQVCVAINFPTSDEEKIVLDLDCHPNEGDSTEEQQNGGYTFRIQSSKCFAITDTALINTTQGITEGTNVRRPRNHCGTVIQ
jgi:hypothetical protein